MKAITVAKTPADARAQLRKLKRGLRVYAVVVKALEPLDKETRLRVLNAAAVLVL